MWTEKTILSENGDVIKYRHDRAPDHSTVSIQNGGQTPPCGFNFAPISRADILKMRMRRVHLSMHTEGKKRFQNGYGVVAWTGENDTKTIRVDANLSQNGARELRFRLKTD